MPGKQPDPMDNMASFFAGPPPKKEDKPQPGMSDALKPISQQLESRIMALPTESLQELAMDFMQSLTPDEQEDAIADAEAQIAPSAPENQLNEGIDYESGMVG